MALRQALQPLRALVRALAWIPPATSTSTHRDVAEIGASGFRTDRTELESTKKTHPRPALSDLKPGTLVIDFSTIAAPATSRRLAATLTERQVAYIDSPVTGAPKAPGPAPQGLS